MPKSHEKYVYPIWIIAHSKRAGFPDKYTEKHENHAKKNQLSAHQKINISNVICKKTKYEKYNYAW